MDGAKMFYEKSYKIVHNLDREKPYLKMWHHIVPHYCNAIYRKYAGNNTYGLVKHLDNEFFFKWSTQLTKGGAIKVIGLPINDELNKSKSISAFLDLLYTKKFPVIAELNQLEVATLIKYCEVKGLPLPKIKKEYADDNFFDEIPTKVEIMNTKKWHTNKVRNVDKMEGVEVRKLSYYDAVDVMKLYSDWLSVKKKQKDMRFDTFYKNIISDGYEDLLCYGLFYKGKLVMAEGNYGHSEDVMSMIWRISQLKDDSIPKKIMNYGHFLLMKVMYNDFHNLGYKRIYAGGSGGKKDPLFKHKSDWYDKYFEYYRVTDPTLSFKELKEDKENE